MQFSDYIFMHQQVMHQQVKHTLAYLRGESAFTTKLSDIIVPWTVAIVHKSQPGLLTIPACMLC